MKQSFTEVRSQAELGNEIEAELGNEIEAELGNEIMLALGSLMMKTSFMAAMNSVVAPRRWYVVVLAAWGAAAGAVASPGAEAEPRLPLWGPSAAAIVGKLDGGLRAEQPIAGGTLRHQVRRQSDQRTVVVESTLSGGAAEAPVLDLTFRLREPGANPGYARLSYRDAQWYGSTFWTGPDWTRVGKDWHHPGERTPSVRCWHAPRDGRVTIAGRVYKLHLKGDGVRLSILHNAREVWKAEIAGNDAQGVEPRLQLDLHRGDAVRFIVHKRGSIACDTTHWDPVIAYADGQSFQASRAFGAQQGRDGWFYELVGSNDAVTVGTPVIHTLGRDLTLRQSATASDADALPLLVIADGERSAIAVAWNSGGRWSFRASDDPKGLFRVTLTAGVGPAGKLPDVVLVAMHGPWTAGLSWAEPRFATVTRPAYESLVSPLIKKPDLGMLLMAQAEWRCDDAITETPAAYASAVANHLTRARALLDPASHRHAERLASLAQTAARTNLRLEDWRRLYLDARLLKRDVMLTSCFKTVAPSPPTPLLQGARGVLSLSQPALDDSPWLFCKRAQPSYSHLVGQYFGWRQRPGGGLFVLEKPGCSLAVHDVVGPQLPCGSFLEPRLSYDGRRIAFSFVACSAETPDSRTLPVNEEGGEERYYHLYEIGVDGHGLRQLTSGRYDDLMPCYLPDGGIAFVSTRRRSYSRCFGPNFSKRWHSFTLHRLDDAGGEPRILSLNDVSEWFPAVANTGEILFARWDYIDRDAVTHQNLWSMRPDGTNPVAVWGNAAPKPNCTFQAKPIPGSRKLVFIASAHHAVTGGPVCLLDPGIDPNSLDAITRVTPGPFPEAESGTIPEYYESPWPLSETQFLVAYSRDRLIFEGEHMHNPNPDNALGLYLLDAAGNRELIYRDPQIGSTCPMPLRPQLRPPVLPSAILAGAPPQGEMVVANVYQGLGDVAQGSIKELRIVQIFPKATWLSNSPRIGIAGEENARAILGTVPVQADGSARFLVPAHKPLLFQALDAQGNAYQTMRSTTSVQPGEHTSCVGCHEHRMSAPPAPMAGSLLALRRPATPIEPGELGGRPFSFVEVVQPVLDRHCVGCHGGEKTEQAIDLTATAQQGFTRSYWSLCGNVGGKAPASAHEVLVPRFVMRNQIQMTSPGGALGARGSRLMKLLRDGHAGVQLSDSELRRLAAWIDCNAVFYGSFDPKEQSRQLSGQPIPMPANQ